MKIGIDIDDTIIDTGKYLRKRMAEYFGYVENYFIENNIFYFNLPKSLQEKEKDFYFSIVQKEMLNIPVKVFAREAISKLKEDNDIIIITSRDNFLYDDSFALTKEQLDCFGILYDKIICTNDKYKACVEEQIDIFVDDSMDNVKSVSKQVDSVFLFNSDYNKNFDVPFQRVYDWMDLYERIRTLTASNNNKELSKKLISN